MDNNIIYLTKHERTLSSFIFYTEILDEVRDYYHSDNYNNSKSPPIFSFEIVSKVSSEVLPLLISLGSYLKKYHKTPIKLLINNNLGETELKFLEFLEHSGFFNIVGGRKLDSENKLYFTETPSNIFDFNDNLIGGFDYNKKHYEYQRLCKFNKLNFNIPTEDSSDFETERTELISYLKVFIKNNLKFFKYNKKYFIDPNYFELNVFNKKEELEVVIILAELLANSLLYSEEEEVNYIWHSNSKRIILSISDYGKGLYNSINSKTSSENYVKFELYNELEKLKTTKNLEKNIKEDFLSIYESLFFSSIKLREGLIDLIFYIIIKNNGKIRIHNNSTQIIFSSTRHLDFFIKLQKIRVEILKKLYSNESITELKVIVLKLFIENFKSTYSKISDDIIYSPIRFYKTSFNGVHIEAELKKN